MNPSRLKLVTLALPLAFLLAGCNLKFDAPILPSLGKRLPEGTPQSELNKDLTATSRNESSTKLFLANLIIHGDVASDLNLDRDNNCAQLVQLTNQSVVLDFYNDVCPPNNRIGDVSRLQFAAGYAPMAEERNHYKLKLTAKEIGEMEINSDGTELTLLRLCTGRYDTYCVQNVANRRLSGAPILLY